MRACVRVSVQGRGSEGASEDAGTRSVFGMHRDLTKLLEKGAGNFNESTARVTCVKQ